MNALTQTQNRTLAELDMDTVYPASPGNPPEP
jgi:hypothetical protein